MIFFVTGAANGIGQGVAQALYAQGHSLVVADIDLQKMQQWTAQYGCDDDRLLVVQLDVRLPYQWENALRKAVEKFGRIDVGMNIAGVIRAGYVTDFGLEDVDFMIDINLKGVIYGTKLMAEQMLQQGGGQIVNVASLAGVAPVAGLPVYVASKFGVRAFSISAAQELGPRGIAVSVVCPDLVNTQMLTDQLPHPAANLTFSGDRVLTVEEITKVILERAVAQKQLEVLYPRYRGWLGKLGNLFPQLAPLIAGMLQKKGEKRRLALQKQS